MGEGRCRECGGSGQVGYDGPDFSADTCPECHGSGEGGEPCCPECGGDVMLAAKIGTTQWWQCRQCGADIPEEGLE